jgi:hypothetical protein
MVRRPADGLGINPAKPKPGQIEPPDKDINHEPHYPRKSNLPGIQEKGCCARDPSPQQSASSDPSANRPGIIPRESHRPARFDTWGNRRCRFPPELHASKMARTIVDQYVALDVSLQKTAVCVLNVSGCVLIEADVLSEPAALIAFIQTHAPRAARVGLESGPTSS